MDSDEVRARAEAIFKKKESANNDATDVETYIRLIREKMARLRALRLAREAAQGQSEG